MVARKLELKRRYGETAQLYDRRYEEIQRKKYSAILPSLPRANKILDLGCGTGMFLGELAKLGKFVVGADSSAPMLSIAKQRSAGAFFLLADADSLPFADGGFDVVVSVTLLQNMPNPVATVKEIARVTASGGILALSTLKRKHSLGDLESWVRQAGLEVLKSGEVEGSEDVLCIARR